MNFDYLPYIDLPYKQPEDAYHFNTDTVLLGLFLPDLNNRKILDIGTNCGALLCYAAKKNASMLYGLDLNKEALEYADINLKQCGAKFSLFHQNFKDFAIFELDAVVVNPPFYPDKERDSVSENLAMNSSNMPSVELFSKCRSILKDNGSIYSIYPADRLNSYIEAASQNDFSVSMLQPVYDSNKSCAIRVLLKFRRGHKDSTRFAYPVFIKDGNILKDKGIYLNG